MLLPELYKNFWVRQNTNSHHLQISTILLHNNTSLFKAPELDLEQRGLLISSNAASMFCLKDAVSNEFSNYKFKSQYLPWKKGLASI